MENRYAQLIWTAKTVARDASQTHSSLASRFLLGPVGFPLANFVL